MSDEKLDAGAIARSQAIAGRRAQARSVATSPRVRVLPRDETVRKHIVHWPTGIAFPAEGSVEWPNDRFTQRRIRDGDVTIEGAEAAKGQVRPASARPVREG